MNRAARATCVAVASVGLLLGLPFSASASEHSDETLTNDRVSVTQMEQALDRLGLPVEKVNGDLSAADRRAVCAWRELTGRGASREVPVPQDERAAMMSSTVEDLSPTRGMIVGLNVNRECQTITWIVRGKDGSKKIRGVFAATTGGPGYSTPVGVYSIYRETNRWHESTGYPGAMMYRPKYFRGGIAFHGSATDSYVVPYPASHGCVRMLHKDIDKLWRADVSVGTRVKVYGDWQG